MKTRRFWIYGLMTSLLLLMCSCKKNDFYEKISNWDNCQIPCYVQFLTKPPILIVEPKKSLLNIFKENSIGVDESSLIEYLKRDIPIMISETLYYKFYGRQILPQKRIDSMAMINIDGLLEKSYRKNARKVNRELFISMTGMEVGYIIKLLFDHKILIDDRDLEIVELQPFEKIDTLGIFD